MSRLDNRSPSSLVRATELEPLQRDALLKRVLRYSWLGGVRRYC